MFLRSLSKLPLVRNILSNRARLKLISQYPDRKKWWVVLWELHNLKARGGLSKYDYMQLAVFRTTSGDPKDYLPYDDCFAVLEKVNFPKWNKLLDDKLLFNDHMEANNIAVPKLLGSFVGNSFDIRLADGTKSFDAQDAEIALQHLKELGTDGVSFAKIVDGKGGHHAFKITADMATADFVAALGEREFIFQRNIEQSATLAAFHPQSLNTFRLNTVWDKTGIPRAISGFLRVGRGGSVVDNASSGGILISVNMDTGKLQHAGVVFSSLGGGYFESHPETGVPFEGFTLPHFKECCDLACQYALTIPNPIIGWDFAFTDDGPILIEANHGIGYTVDQAVAGPMKYRWQFQKYAAHYYYPDGI